MHDLFRLGADGQRIEVRELGPPDETAMPWSDRRRFAGRDGLPAHLHIAADDAARLADTLEYFGLGYHTDVVVRPHGICLDRLLDADGGTIVSALEYREMLWSWSRLDPDVRTALINEGGTGRNDLGMGIAFYAFAVACSRSGGSVSW